MRAVQGFRSWGWFRVLNVLKLRGFELNGFWV